MTWSVTSGSERGQCSKVTDVSCYTKVTDVIRYTKVRGDQFRGQVRGDQLQQKLWCEWIVTPRSAMLAFLCIISLSFAAMKGSNKRACSSLEDPEVFFFFRCNRLVDHARPRFKNQ